MMISAYRSSCYLYFLYGKDCLRHFHCSIASKENVYNSTLQCFVMREKVHVYLNIGVLIIMCIPFSRGNFTFVKERIESKALILTHFFGKECFFKYLKLFVTLYSYCTAKCRIFSSNPRRTHSGKKDKEKGECGLPGAVICPMPPLLSPLPPTPRICCTACGHVIRIS